MNIVSNLIEAHIFRITDTEIEFLLLKRAEGEKYPGVWQMVTGSIENEKAFETALREIKEETSLIPDKLWVVPKVNMFYSSEQDYVCLVPVFAAMVSESSEVIISEEHSEYKWVGKLEAQSLLSWQGQKESVETIYEYLSDKKSFLKFAEIPLTQI
jgi:dihydroneopterin triphosphate diphosphatase